MQFRQGCYRFVDKFIEIRKQKLVYRLFTMYYDYIRSYQHIIIM